MIITSTTSLENVAECEGAEEFRHFPLPFLRQSSRKTGKVSFGQGFCDDERNRRETLIEETKEKFYEGGRGNRKLGSIKTTRRSFLHRNRFNWTDTSGYTSKNRNLGWKWKVSFYKWIKTWKKVVTTVCFCWTNFLIKTTKVYFCASCNRVP